MYKPRWKNPCILEHLLSDLRKASLIAKLLDKMGLRIRTASNSKWFDIVKKGGG